MRNLQARLADPLVPVHQNIQIQRAWPITDAGRAVTSEFPLNAQQAVKQGARVEFGREGDNGVQETGLVGEAHRFRRVQRRTPDYAAQGFEAIRCGGEGCLGVAGRAGEVRAHPDVGGVHESRLSPGVGRLAFSSSQSWLEVSGRAGEKMPL